MSESMSESKFQLIFDLERIFTYLKDDLHEIDNPLEFIFEEICTKTIETIEIFEYYEEDTWFSKYGDVDELIVKVKAQFSELIEKAVYDDDPNLLEEFATDCPILPPFGGDEYLLVLNFEEVSFGRFGKFASHAIFEEATQNKIGDEKLDMMANTWVTSEKEGYAYELGKQDLTDVTDMPFRRFQESLMNIYF